MCFTLNEVKKTIDNLNAQIVKKGNSLVNPDNNQELIRRLGIFFNNDKKELLALLQSIDEEEVKP
jgi:hypothetical protein